MGQYIENIVIPGI